MSSYFLLLNVNYIMKKQISLEKIELNKVALRLIFSKGYDFSDARKQGSGDKINRYLVT